MITLRSYQQEAIDVIRTTFETRYRQYIEMPTGSGKTVTFLSYASKYHNRILIVVPSIQLMKQVYETALLFYSAKEISRRGDGFYQSEKTLHIMTAQSLRGDYLKHLASKRFTLTIFDECHHAHTDTYLKFLEARMVYWSLEDMKVLGVTATPDRYDGKSLDLILHKKSFQIQISTLIKAKHLCNIEGFSVKTNISLSSLSDNNRDFSVGDLYKNLAQESRNNLIIDLYKKDMGERKTLVFCINVKHCIEIANLYKQAGVSASAIYGDMHDDEKKAILNAFRRGEIKVLCNCQLLTEGFDEPSISGIILARPTISRSLFIQMIGRGLRNSPGKENCKIIDIVDSHKSLVGFAQISSDNKFEPIEKFSSFDDIEKQLEKSKKEEIKLKEFKIQRIDLFNNKEYEKIPAVHSMIQDLLTRKIDFYPPITFDEASFLIWLDKLKQEKNAKNL